jgi:hypothetical protein
MAKNKTSFGRGKSVNPGGRPRKRKELVQRCRDIVDEDGVDALHDEVRERGERWVECMKLLLAYGYGRPTEHIEATVTHEEAAPKLTLDELREVARMGIQQRLAAEHQADDDDDDEPSSAPH